MGKVKYNPEMKEQTAKYIVHIGRREIRKQGGDRTRSR